MDGSTKRVTAAVMIIGDEILSGRTQDTNLRDIAKFLGVHGVDLCEARTVADVHGNAVTVWSTSSAAQATVGAVGSAAPGLVTAIEPGTPSIGATIGSVTATAWPRQVAVRRSELFPMTRVRACGADWVAVNRQLARAGVVRRCHRAGIRTMVWTVDEDREIAHWLADPRVDVLITNRPEYAVRTRAGRQAAAAR